MELIEIRRRLMMQDTGDLPGAYRRVEYIGSNGTQYIVTDIPCPAEIVAYADMAITNTSKDQYGWGNRKLGYLICGFGQYNQYYQCFYDTAYHWRWDDGFRINENQRYATKQIYTDGYQTYYVDGVQYGTWDKALTKTEQGANIWIFAANGSTLYSYMNLYHFKLTNADETVVLGDFIPCVRKSDNKPGMYDTVTKTFYTNAGTGEFIVPT